MNIIIQCVVKQTFKWLQITQYDVPALLSKSGSAVWLAAIFGSWHLSELLKYESVWSLLQFKVGNCVKAIAICLLSSCFIFFIPRSSCLIQCCALARHSVHIQEVLHSSVLVVTLHYTCRWTLGNTLYLERKLQLWCWVLSSNVNALCLSAAGLALQHA